jgi:hypothetical protein
MVVAGYYLLAYVPVVGSGVRLGEMTLHWSIVYHVQISFL